MTTSTLTKSNTEYVKDYSLVIDKDMPCLIDKEAESLNALNPDKIYTQYFGTDVFSGFNLWYKVGRRYVCVYRARSYYGYTYGNPKNAFDRRSVTRRYPTDKDGYSVPCSSDTKTKADATGRGCPLKKLIKD